VGAREGRARAVGWAAVLAAALAAMPEAAGAQDRSIEYAVKAAYLYKFAPFVEWPPHAFASASSPLQLCIVGHDPFGANLDQAVSGQRVGGRPVVVRRLERVDVASGCHIAFLGVSHAQTTADALRALRGSPTLTVADNVRDAGAIIRFVIKDNRVRFDIDTAAAAANGVTISSKLLSLATPHGAGGAS
jgi:hypothetical protein